MGRVGEGPRLPATEEERWSEGDHSFSASSVVRYTARADHSNSSLACSVLQGERLFPQRVALILQVSTPTPTAALLPSNTGLILGSSLAALLLLLLLLLLAVFLWRGRGRVKRAALSPRSGPGQPTVWTSDSDNWTCQQREGSSVSTASSSSFQTNRSLGDLPCLGSLQGWQYAARGSPLAPRLALAAHSAGWLSLSSLDTGPPSPGRPASAPAPLCPPSLPPPAPGPQSSPAATAASSTPPPAATPPRAPPPRKTRTWSASSASPCW